MSSKITPPKNYQLVQTEDGSFTFFSEEFQENCHSTSGAASETKNYFINESELFKCQDEDVIFEVGFGLGVGLNEVLKWSTEHKKKLTFISTEIDEKLVQWYFENFNNFYSDIKKVGQKFTCKSEFLNITILIGDARKTTPLFFKNNQLKISRIFQDAFSPKKSPSLWEQSWFEELIKHSNRDCILTTYSASSSVIENLKLAGFHVEKIKGFGKKRAATKASIK